MNVKKIIIYAMFTVIILITSGCSNDNMEYTKSDKKEEKGIEITGRGRKPGRSPRKIFRVNM